MPPVCWCYMQEDATCRAQEDATYRVQNSGGCYVQSAELRRMLRTECRAQEHATYREQGSGRHPRPYPETIPLCAERREAAGCTGGLGLLEGGGRVESWTRRRIMADPIERLVLEIASPTAPKHTHRLIPFFNNYEKQLKCS